MSELKERVLLVDDDEFLLKGVRRQLRKKFDLELATGGLAAKAILDAGEEFAVIVSDMQMPDMNGLEVLTYAKEKSPSTVRIMLTGNADRDTAIDAEGVAEVFQFLNKPCERNELESVITEAIELYRSNHMTAS